jgi:FkbM family methyltransferase
LDVGANDGLFGRHLRRIGYRGRIVSFEPVREPFIRLASFAEADAMWEVHQFGLGASDADAMINVSGNSHASSLLELSQRSLEATPEVGFVREESIRICRLDGVFPEVRRGANSVFLKIDTQGFERQVLDGSEASLRSIGMLQLEMSLVSLYAGEALFEEQHARLRGLGYRLVALEPGLADPRSAELMQFDAVYRRP